jgi:hypothetical protein
MTAGCGYVTMPNDTFGVGFGVGNLGPWASALDRDQVFLSGAYVPVSGAETFLGAMYQAQVASWLQVRPDFAVLWMWSLADPTNQPSASAIRPSPKPERR